MNEYSTGSELKEYAFTEADDLSPQETETLRLFCTIASRMMDGETHRFFYPKIDTLEFDHPEDDTRLMVAPHDLLEISTFTTNNTSTSVTSAQYYLMTGNSYNHTPYDRIVMKSSGTRPNLLYSGTPQQANAIAGTWGYHEDWSNAWQDSGDTVQNSTQISSSGTSLTVSDADGNDIYGIAPRFRVQHLLKIGSEFLYVTAINTTTNVLTVRRGVNGSTAAAHTNGTSIYVYVPMEEIQIACRRLAKWLYDARTSSYDDQIALVDANGNIRLPQSMPVDVRMTLARYRRRDVR